MLHEQVGVSDELVAVRNYEKYFKLPEGSASIDQVASTSCGIQGWAAWQPRDDFPEAQNNDDDTWEDVPGAGETHQTTVENLSAEDEERSQDEDDPTPSDLEFEEPDDEEAATALAELRGMLGRESERREHNVRVVRPRRT